MGADIHWIIERQDKGDVWRAVASKSRMWATHPNLWNVPAGAEDPSFARLLAIGSRNYLLFGLLSNVRVDVRRPLATDGIPPDASDGARAEIDRCSGDAHSHGWLDPLAVTLADVNGIGANIIRGRDHFTAEDIRQTWSWWKAAYKAALAHDCDEILPNQAYDQDQREAIWEDISGVESGHVALQRLALGKTLHPVSAKGRSRVLIFYDN